MKFQLIQKSQNRVQTKFHVLSQAGDVVGGINVENHEVPDLLRCWSGATDSPPQRQGGRSPVSVLAKAFLQAKSKSSFSRAAVLRGCL